MNKYKDLLEQHIQWVALAIGALWLLFMVYTYVIVADSSSVEVGGQRVGAASVDKFVRDNKAIPLRERIERPDKLLDKVEDYSGLIVEQLAVPMPPALGEIFVNAASGVNRGDPPPPPPPPPAKPITSLPVVAAAVLIDASVGRTVVNVPAPGPTAVGGAPAAANVQMVSWVTVVGTIPIKALAEEFNKKIVNPLPPFHQTMLMKVELIREELQPNGQWSKPVTIASKDLSGTPGPAPELAWPAANNRTAQMQYVSAAGALQPKVAQPAFYPYVRGEQWHLPGQVAAPPAGANQPPEVVQPPQPPPAVNPNPPRKPIPGSVKPGTTPRPTGRRNEQGNAAPALPAGTVAYAQVFSDQAPPTLTTPTPGTGMGVGVNPANAPAAVVPPANLPGQVPTGQFDPANANDFQVWVHDVTVEPGKTYQYRLRYSIKNPVFSSNNVCKPPTLGDVFTIDSEPSALTKPITIPNTTIFFVTGAPNVSGQVKNVNIEVFTWTINGLSKKAVSASPGDMIDDALKVSLVDIRDGGTNVILMDEHGALSSRNAQTDWKSKEYQDAKTESEKPTAVSQGN